MLLKKILLNNIILILTFFLISSCATTVVDQRKVIPELFDPELKKGIKVGYILKNNKKTRINKVSGKEI